MSRPLQGHIIDIPDDVTTPVKVLKAGLVQEAYTQTIPLGDTFYVYVDPIPGPVIPALSRAGFTGSGALIIRLDASTQESSGWIDGMGNLVGGLNSNDLWSTEAFILRNLGPPVVVTNSP